MVPKDSKAIIIIREIRTLLEELEGYFPSGTFKDNRSVRRTAKESLNTDYSGASGGLRMLFEEEGYFNQIRSLTEVIARLRQEGFNYPRSTISMALLRAVRNRTLVRLSAKGRKGREKWAYVIRK